MTNSSMKAKIVRIKIHEGKSGHFFAKSPELRGLLVMEPTIDELLQAIPVAIRDLYAACGQDVVVEQAEGGDAAFTPWVAIPAEIARKALENRV